MVQKNEPELFAKTYRILQASSFINYKLTGEMTMDIDQGERAPLWNSHARGMFIGMSLDTTRDEIIRSVFEGTAFALRHVMDTIKEAGGKAECLRITAG